MNSASGGLRSTVGLRRPKKHALRRRRPTPGAQRLGRPISIGTEPSAGGLHAEWIRPPGASGRRSTCADQKVPPRIGEGRRPARQRLRRPISISTEPPADGRPAPTEKARSASAKADARRAAPLKADFNRHRAFGRRPARRMNSASGGLRPTVGLRRPKKHAPRRRRPTPGASAPSKADFNRHRAFGRRPARRMNSASGGLRSTVGLRRPKKHAPRRRRPTPGAQRLW